jgi:hypothetical protein
MHSRVLFQWYSILGTIWTKAVYLHKICFFSQKTKRYIALQTYSLDSTHFVQYYNIFRIKSFHK